LIITLAAVPAIIPGVAHMVGGGVLLAAGFPSKKTDVLAPVILPTCMVGLANGPSTMPT
jgi:hypothetical protein